MHFHHISFIISRFIRSHYFHLSIILHTLEIWSHPIHAVHWRAWHPSLTNVEAKVWTSDIVITNSNPIIVFLFRFWIWIANLWPFLTHSPKTRERKFLSRVSHASLSCMWHVPQGVIVIVIRIKKLSHS